MKLLIQHPHREGEISGVLTSIAQLVPTLVAEFGVDVRVMSSRTTSLAEQLALVRWCDAVMLNSNSLWIVFLGKILRRPTLLKLHFLQYQTVHWTFVPRGFGSRMYAELKHLYGLQTTGLYRFQAVSRLALRTLVALCVDRVCACSRFCAEQAELPRRIAVLRNPLRVAAGLPPRNRRDLDRPPRFVFVGRITADKGWGILIEACELLQAGGHDFRLDIAGDGPDFEVLRQRVCKQNLAGGVRLLGHIDSEAVGACFAGALAAIVPSRFQEPAGYVAVEAAAAQVIAIVARVGGLPDTAGSDCPTFESGDAADLAGLMIRLLSDPEGAVASGRAAYLRVCREFTPSQVASDLLTLLR